LRSQITVALLLTWVPTIAIGIVVERVSGTRVTLIHDVAVHVRLLIATPLLLCLDRVFPRTCTHAVDQLSSDEFIKPHDRERFEGIVERTRHYCEWWIPEATLAVAAVLVGAWTLVVNAPWSGTILRSGLTPADWWYGLVGSPLFEFMLLRSLWRWGLWASFLVGISRIDLDLEPTHPDRRCGISFLRKPSVAYCALLLFAVSAVLSAGWSERFQLSTLASFIPFLLVFAAFAIAVAFGPLVLFAFALHRTRLAASDELGGLAARNGRWFRQRWIGSESGLVLDNTEVQSLAAIAQTYRETVKQVRLVLFEKKDLILLVAATLLPVVPTMLMRLPSDEWSQMASFLVSKGGIP
jgi:hypothetical protein